MTRVRGFTQDDAHIFCTEDQIHGEVLKLIDLTLDVYKDFGFDEPPVMNLSTRPEQRVGEDALWDKAEKALQEALEDKGLPWQLQEGEGAFYGPKIDFSLKDSIGRVWQVGTVQLDFSMPGRLDAEFVDTDGVKKTPVMIHRAILGSMERFLGVLIEHYAGSLPVWLAPVQAVVLNITDRQDGYVRAVEQSLKNQGFRVESDLRNEKIGFKIREHTIQRVPYLLVAGDREVDSETVAVRTRTGEDLGSMTLDAFADRLALERASRGRISLED